MTNEELAQSIRAPMFGERDNLKDAFTYAQKLAWASDNPAAVLTAVHVVANTIAKQLREAQP